MVKGYTGKLLRVSLDEKKGKKEDLNFSELKKYIGGVGYGAKLLYDELKEGIDPLSPNNKMVLTTSPLTTNTVPGGGSIELCFRRLSSFYQYFGTCSGFLTLLCWD